MTCPICNNKTNIDFRPFCSKGCANIDLNRWLNGSYAIDDSGKISHNINLHETEEPIIKEYRFED